MVLVTSALKQGFSNRVNQVWTET